MRDDENTQEDLLPCAVAVAQTLDGEEQSEVTEAIALPYAQRGALYWAVELAETIPDPYLKDRVIGAIAATTIGAGVPNYSDVFKSCLK